MNRSLPISPRLTGFAVVLLGWWVIAGCTGEVAREAPPAEGAPLRTPAPEAVAETEVGMPAEEEAEVPDEVEAPEETSAAPAARADTVVPEPPPPVTVPEVPPTFSHPDRVRGIYLNAWTGGSARRLTALLDMVRGTEVNAFVIDIKDASGYVSHSTGVALAREVGAVGEIRIRDLNGLLQRLSAEGIYPIARIVIVKDPILVASRPDLAVQDTAGGVWVDSNGIRWLNPHDTTVWDYHLDLAREVAALGFPEIQFDYVRFPDAPAEDLNRAFYPGAGERGAPETIRAFLQYARGRLQELDVVLTADVFGVTTSSRDVGIGQIWESFIDVVDVALPMVYPSHYWQGSFGIEEPNAHPYEIVHRALSDARRRSEAVPGAGATRPWLQAFSLGEPPYGAPEVRAQIQATYDVGIEEWILWNPSSRYARDYFEPQGGFREEPLIRVANRLVPVSERFQALEAASAAELDSTRVVPPVEVKPDTMAGAPDTTTVR